MISAMRLFAVALMALMIAVSPVLAGLSPTCAPNECVCADMAGVAGPHEAMENDPGCGCRSAGKAPCCLAENQIPEQPSGALPLERTGVSAPALNACGSAAITSDMPVTPENQGYDPPFNRMPPSPLVYLLHQCFLI